MINEAQPVTATTTTRVWRFIGIIEKVLFVAALAFFLMKVTLIPSGSFLTIIVLTLLSGLYFPITLLYSVGSDQFKGNSKGAIAYTSLTLSTAIMAILFEINVWPGMGMTFISIAMLVGAIVLAIVMRKKAAAAASNWILIRATAITIPLLFFAFTTPSQFYGMYGPYKNNAQYMQLYKQCYDERTNCEAWRDYHMQLLEKDWEVERQNRQND